MAQNDLISEVQASSFAGVSPLTLGRFAEAGYLKVETATSGEKLYSQSELCDLFGLTQKIEVEKIYVEPYISESEVISEAEVISELDVSKPEEVFWAETVEPSPSQNGDSANHEGAKAIEPPTDSSKQNVIIEMQEKLLEMREREVAELKRDRDWLRQRIERFEEKSDRDQLLLLSETQLIRKLVVMTQQQKPSFWRGTMEWLGLLPPVNHNTPELPAHTTEIKPRIAND